MGSKRGLPLGQVLLGFLMKGPMHGYDLHQRVQEELGEVWYMGLSRIYGVLKELEQAGLVCFDLLSQGNRPPRKMCQITQAGKLSFLQWLHQPVPSMRDIRVEFPAKLYFFRALGLGGSGDLIAAQITVCQERLERVEQRAAQCSPHDLYRLVFDFRCRQIEAILGWLQDCRETWGQ